MTKQKTPRVEKLRTVRIELTTLPRNGFAPPKTLLKPTQRNAAPIPNNKKVAQGTFRVIGNLANTRK